MIVGASNNLSLKAFSAKAPNRACLLIIRSRERESLSLFTFSDEALTLSVSVGLTVLFRNNNMTEMEIVRERSQIM